MDKIPDIIYHYTTKEAFLKIFSSDSPELRMYPVNQMNDPMECKWAFYLMSKQQLYPELPPNCPEQFIRPILKFQNSGIKKLRDSISFFLEYLTSYPPLLGSFTSHQGIYDGLTFWREYSAQGSGLSIGIYPQKVIEQQKLNGNFYFGKVCYDKHEQREDNHLPEIYKKLDYIFDEFFTITNTIPLNTTYINLKQIKEILINKLNTFVLLSEVFDEKYKNIIIKQITEQEIHKEISGPNLFNLLDKLDDNLITQFLTFLNIINCFIKQYAYEPEQEYRFIKFDPVHFQKVHENTAMSIESDFDPETGKTYFPLPLNNDIVQEIIIGPNCPLSALDVETILKKCGITAKVQKSLIHMVQKY